VCINVNILFVQLVLGLQGQRKAELLAQ
jgi:hypothetical protein